MYLATLETRHFTFESLSDTKEGAINLIRKGWEKHCKQTGADVSYLNELDIEVRDILVGRCYRDEEELIGKP